MGRFGEEKNLLLPENIAWTSQFFWDPFIKKKEKKNLKKGEKIRNFLMVSVLLSALVERFSVIRVRLQGSDSSRSLGVGPLVRPSVCEKVSFRV